MKRHQLFTGGPHVWRCLQVPTVDWRSFQRFNSCLSLAAKYSTRWILSKTSRTV